VIFGFDTAAARRYAELVNRLFAIEGDAAPLPPGFILELERPEWAFLKRELFWSTGQIIVAANVGNVSRLQIHNPPLAKPSDPGRIVVVEGFVVTAPVTAGIYFVTRDGALAGTPTTNLATDTRVPVGSVSRKVSSLNRIDNTLPSFSGDVIAIRQAVIGADVIFNFRVGPERPIVLAPNTVCEVVDSTTNQGIRAVAVGYERPATPDELAS
jgi:hypothetical protein